MPAKRVQRPDLTARTQGEPLSYDAAGFLARVSADHLRLAPDEVECSYELLAQLATKSARRGSSVGNPELGRGRHPRRALVAPDQIAVPAYADRSLTITVRRSRRCWSPSAWNGDAVRLFLRGTPGRTPE